MEATGEGDRQVLKEGMRLVDIRGVARFHPKSQVVLAGQIRKFGERQGIRDGIQRRYPSARREYQMSRSVLECV